MDVSGIWYYMMSAWSHKKRSENEIYIVVSTIFFSLIGIVPPNDLWAREGTESQTLVCGLEDDAETVTWLFTPFNDDDGETSVDSDGDDRWSVSADDDNPNLSALTINTVTAETEPPTAGVYR